MLNRKMRRDILQNKIQFFSIFIMVFLGAFVYAGIGGEWFGAQQTGQAFYKETNAADLWIYGQNFTTQDIDEIEKTPGITAIEKRLTLKGTAELKNNPELELNFITENQLSAAKTMKGMNFDHSIKGIWLDHSFAKANHLTIGQDFTVTFQGNKLTFPIKGFILSPDYVYYTAEGTILPDHKKTGYAYIPYTQLPAEMKELYTVILAKTSHSQDATVIRRLENNTNLHYSAALTRNDQKSYQTFQEEIQQHKAMGSIFPFAFLAIAMLTVVTTMTRLISQQRTLIGTLKALGFKNRKILFHYVSYGFVISFLGALLGSILGPFILPPIFYPAMSNSYALPEWKPVFSAQFIILPVILVILCSFISYLVTRQFLKEKPTEAMKPRVITFQKKGLQKQNLFWNKLSFSAKWNLRDIFRNKLRSLMAILGIAGCTSLLLCAFGLRDSIQDVLDWQFNDIHHYQTQIVLQNKLSDDEISKIATKYDGEETMTNAIEIKKKDLRKSGTIQVLENNQKMIQFYSPTRKQKILTNDGIALTYKMAEILGVKEGEKIEWHLYGKDKWHKSSVVMLYHAPLSQGITVSKDYFEDLGETFKATQILTQKTNVKKSASIESILRQAEMRESTESMMEMMNLMIGILIFAAVIMAAVVLYCLGIISFSEKYRELATLKVLGFHTKRLRKLLLVQNMYLTIVGIPLGFVGGYYLMDAIMKYMGDSMDLLTYISVPSFILCGIGTLITSVLISLLFSQRVKTIDMVSALKGNES